MPKIPFKSKLAARRYSENNTQCAKYMYLHNNTNKHTIQGYIYKAQHLQRKISEITKKHPLKYNYFV